MRLRARHPLFGRGIISPAVSSHPRTTWHNIFYLVAEAARFRFLFVEQALLASVRRQIFWDRWADFLREGSRSHLLSCVASGSLRPRELLTGEREDEEMTASASTTKVALITGGGTGIGRAIASALHRDDHTVAILGRRPERLESLEGFHAYACDISDWAAVRETVAKLLSDLGRLDVLVNNAGVIRNGSLEDTTEEDIEYQVNVNVLGTINMTKACLPSLKACKGSIINVSSTLAWLPILEHSIYTAISLLVPLPHRRALGAISCEREGDEISSLS